VLTISISVAAGASAVSDYVPGLAPERIPLALGCSRSSSSPPPCCCWRRRARRSKLFTLAMNLARGPPIISLAAALLIGLGLHRLWLRAGRPRGIASVLVEAESGG
jgi:hypothetical protein